MYQALYRKWRPRTFDDVVGQSHITDTLKRQVATGRLSHAYLFTGTRGTGKTTCAKILARAVNCEHPVDGNPCNQCPSCLGIESGSILDVLELDAASNNGVDQVRALRDEAVYTPAAVRKRVYIVDEVHMLSTAAFNALLKILEEPPEHLMFILATTELHKVPATIKSRCQQFSFKRILPGDIAARLAYVAREEGIELRGEGASLLARLADGGLRDALSLLDQCAGPSGPIGEQEVLDALGLAGNLETARLMEQLGGGDTAGALETLARLYGAGKDVGSLLGELSALTRDLLIRKTAPQGGAALLTGGYDENTMRRLSNQFQTARLVQMLGLLQTTIADLSRSGNRRTDTELCLIRLCDPGLDESTAALNARLARVEELLAPAMLAIKSIPVASFIILALILFSSRNLAVPISFLIVLPVLYSNVLGGIRAADSQLMEMARVFRIPVGRSIRYVYLPQVMPYFLSACGSALGLCWKSGIAAEVIGMPEGSIGEQLQQAKVYLDTPDLFAWTLVIVLVSLAFERAFLALLRRGARAMERM